MKRRYLILAGLLAVSIIAAGCGKKNDTTEETQQAAQEAQVTVTPAAQKAETDTSNLVDMQQSTDETAGITKIMGTKSTTASNVILINKTGDEVAAIYIRPYTEDSEDDEWGDDLVNGSFTLKNGEKAIYYYEKDAKDSEGNKVTKYDVRITYKDEEKSECFFRQLPLSSMTQLSLCMDGTGDDAIPYARYVGGTSKKEVSTLNDVKKRLGLSDSTSSDSEEDTETTTTSTDSTTDNSSSSDTTTSDNTTGNTEEDPQSSHDDLNNQPEDPVSTAEGYIGQSLDDLIAACGNPTGSDYENEPETGETGYHYYDTFTVSTTVDEDGNETVAGIW